MDTIKDRRVVESGSELDINRAAPAVTSGEAVIAADPETVFSVIAAIDAWPSWNPDVKSATVDGAVESGTVFRWKAGPSSLTSRLEVVEPPHAIAWTGRTMGIKAIHVFRFEAREAGTLARSEESWEGLIPRLLRGWSRRTLEKGIRHVLARLKTESERRATSA